MTKSKHKPVADVSLNQLKALFSRAGASDRISLGDAIACFKLDAKEADGLLRKVARNGYLTFERDRFQVDAPWKMQETAHRLVADKLLPRIPREKVDEILEDLLRRARDINSDGNRLICITRLRLFGSALRDDLADYGDVDVEVTIEPKQLQNDEICRRKQIISKSIPNSFKDNGINRVAPEKFYDHKSARRQLKQGLRYLSLSENQLAELRCDFQTIYAFDPAAREEIDPSTDQIEAPIGIVSEVGTTQEPNTLPPVTAISPEGIPGNDETIPIEKTHLVSVESLPEIEGRTWLGSVASNGRLYPLDSSGNPETQFSGSQHLCPYWKEDIPGIEMLVRSLDWAALKNTGISKVPRRFILRTYPGKRIANFGAFGWREGFHLMAQRVADRIDAHLLICDKSPSTRNEVAANYSASVALARLLDETQLSGSFNFFMEFDLDHVRQNRYDPLPSFKRFAAKLRTTIQKQLPYDADALRAAKENQCEWSKSLNIERSAGISWDRALGTEFGYSLSDGAEYPSEDVADHIFAILEENNQQLAEEVNSVPGLVRLTLDYSERPKQASQPSAEDS